MNLNSRDSVFSFTSPLALPCLRAASTFLLRRAELLYRRARGSRAGLGGEHPCTVGSVNNLAGLLRRKGVYEGAERRRLGASRKQSEDECTEEIAAGLQGRAYYAPQRTLTLFSDCACLWRSKQTRGESRRENYRRRGLPPPMVLPLILRLYLLRLLLRLE